MMMMVDVVASFTNFNFHEIYDLRAMEFLGYLVYAQRKKEEEKKMIGRFRQTRQY